MTTRKTGFLLTLICSSFLIASPLQADSTTTTTTTTTTNADGSTTTTVKETVDTPEETQTVVPVVGSGRIVSPTGVTGTIRRSDRRQDRRNGDPRLGDNDDIDIDRNIHREIDRR